MPYRYILLLIQLLPAYIFSAENPTSLTLNIQINVPQLEASPYFKPYVAIWLETEQRQAIDTIALWYQVDQSGQFQEDGKKWLKDLRQWWRKIGRTSAHNYDGVTGATRRPGNYILSFDILPAHIEKAKGKVILNFEAAREEGGRSYQRLTINLNENKTYNIPAERELGDLTVEIINHD